MFKSIITAEMHYDDWADQYDKDIAGWGYHAPDRVLSTMTPFLMAHEQAPRMLDVGIGTGLLSYKCKSVRSDVHITGVDISSGMLDKCVRREAADDLYRVDVSREPFPFKDSCFDVVAASGLMENIEEINHTISEMSRVLRPGGLIVFTFMPTTTHVLREKLAKKLRPGRTSEGRLVLGKLNLYRHNPKKLEIYAKMNGVERLAAKEFVGYRSYVFVTVRYELFAGRKMIGLQ